MTDFDFTNYFFESSTEGAPRILGLALRTLIEWGYLEDHEQARWLHTFGFVSWERMTRSEQGCDYVFDVAIPTKVGIEWLAGLPVNPMYAAPADGDPLDHIDRNFGIIYTREFVECMKSEDLPQYLKLAHKGWTIGLKREKA